jgi:hypothetical protein
MLGALLVSMVILDLGMVYLTYDKISEVAEQALDAALVAGIDQEDADRGQMYINEAPAKLAATDVLKENLRLDDNLENRIMKNTVFTVILYQDQDPAHPGARPYLAGAVKTEVKTISPGLFGLEGIPITVRKTRFHMSNFK